MDFSKMSADEREAAMKSLMEFKKADEEVARKRMEEEAAVERNKKWYEEAESMAETIVEEELSYKIDDEEEDSNELVLLEKIKELIVENKKLKYQLENTPSKTAGSKKSAGKGKKKSVRCITIVDKLGGKKVDCLCKCLAWKNSDGEKTRTVSQCRGEPGEEGLCTKHQKEWDKNGGFCRAGVIDDLVDFKITPEIFGDEERYSLFGPGHKKWVEDYKKSYEEYGK